MLLGSWDWENLKNDKNATEHYLFIPFLKTKVKWIRQKLSQAKNCKRDKQDYHICYKLLLRAINNDFLKKNLFSHLRLRKHFYYNSVLMRIIDDNITQHNSSWSAAQTKRERERERESDKGRQREIEWQRNKTWTRKRRKAPTPKESYKCFSWWDSTLQFLDFYHC